MIEIELRLVDAYYDVSDFSQLELRIQHNTPTDQSQNIVSLV